MEHAFVLRLAAPDAEAAARVAALLTSGLTARGMRVLREGEPNPRAGTTFRLACARCEQAGLTATVGVGPDESASAWLPPLSLSAHPEDAAIQTLAFLERWGFVAAA